MIMVESSYRALEEELFKLSLAEGPSEAIYRRGARDAINWIAHGGQAPSSLGHCVPEVELKKEL